MARETFRRSLKEKGDLRLKEHLAKKREGEILTIARSPVITATQTTRIYDAVKMMVKNGFRRLPIVNAGTKSLEGIVTAMDIVDYLCGGPKFEIVKIKFFGNFFNAINQPVKLIMTQKVVAAKSTAKINDVIDLMISGNIGGLPVVDEDNHVKAIVTEKDVVNLFSDKVTNITVAQLMSDKVVTALPRTTISEAGRLMVAEGFRRLPIVSDGKVQSIVTAMDIVKFFGSGDVFEHLKSNTVIQAMNESALHVAAKEVITIEPALEAGTAARTMHEKSVGAMPVVQNGKLVGIITERDFFKMIA